LGLKSKAGLTLPGCGYADVGNIFFVHGQPGITGSRVVAKRFYIK
jgi:hypothetical protein